MTIQHRQHELEQQLRIAQHNTIHAQQNQWVWTCHVYVNESDLNGCRYICRDSEQCCAIVYNANKLGMTGKDIRMMRWKDLDDGNVTIDAREARKIEE